MAMTPEPMNDTAHPHPDRRDWLSLLAQAPRAALAAHAPPVLKDHRFDWLRRPETGLAMVRARVANGGDRFNVGEATVTRCVVTHQPTGGPATAGVGWVLGRDEERAEWVAAIDALLQVPALRPLLDAAVLAPLRAALQAERTAEADRTATSRVRFFTLQPEAAR